MTPKSAIKSAMQLLMWHLSAIIAVLFWGLSFVSTKIIMEDGGLSPTEAYIYRFLIAYGIVIILSHKRIWCDNWKDEVLMLLCGMTAGSIYFISENTALELTLTTNVSLLSSTSPLVTVMLVGLIYKSERPGMGVIIGSIIAFIGVMCVILNSFTGGFAFEGNPWGDILAISTAFSWALYSLILKRLNVIYDAMFITRKTFFYGLVTALPFFAMQPTLVNPFQAFTNPMVISNLIFLALGASIASFFLWAITIDKMGAVKANNYMYFQPVVTLLASALILRESITMLGYLGFILILGGLWFGDYLQNKISTKTG